MAKSTPKISVAERRLQGPSALRAPSQTITLKDPSYTVRWENSAISPDHLWTLVNALGWEYVTPEDLAQPVDEIGATVRDNRLVRGVRGEEVLMKMPAAIYQQLQLKKAQENVVSTYGKKAKESVVAGVGGALGDEAASWIHRNMTIKDNRAPDDEAPTTAA